MPSTHLIARTRAAFDTIAGVALNFPTHGADEIAVTLDEHACAVRPKAIVRGYRLLGGAGFDIARTGLTPDQQRIAFLCPVT